MTPDPNIADPNIDDSTNTDSTDSHSNTANDLQDAPAGEMNDSNDADAVTVNGNEDGYEDVADADDSPVAEQAVAEAEDLESDTEASVEIEEAKAAFDADDESNATESVEEESQLVELAVPFVGQWNQLISTSNWEKGRIISDWRSALIESGVQSSQYSDEAWTRRVGGVTAPHVGRLRRVYDRFASTYETYAGLYWSHFLAALDWEDAPMWLEGATKENWSVAGMREQRWQAHGAVESNRPTNSQIVEVDLDEDVEPTLPAEGGGRTKEYGDESGVASGPVYEAPDFGEEDELMSLGGASPDGSGGVAAVADPDQPPGASVQPFSGLPELPDDLSDAVESFKLALLRHKTSKWEKVSAETVEKYLQAFAVLLSS
ncbi:hypothetical protein LF1_00600 [Rubripirellula obstinata]|uniref:Uncharacterized protein n=1 Tax=Rubripirellula obstinata TaxID=406547 RepID=A0A5B1CDN3_9BACT|nr:hypothetical protein [Rubripirellula obstinata]KAA1257573.1 hypothetical protein LF1_00600 [Rubripirellula obstinata]